MKWYDIVEAESLPISGDREKAIYRIIPFDSLLEMVSEKVNTLFKTSRWEDVYENFFLKEKFVSNDESFSLTYYQEQLFGQCWTTKQMSDALWRIYSPDTKSVLIKSTVGELWDSVRPVLNGGRCLLGPVKYYPKKKIQNDILDAAPLDVSTIAQLLLASLFVKRTSFSHEAEYRIVYFCEDDSPDKKLDKKVFSIEPLSFIKSIFFDPRADDAFVDRCRTILVKAFSYPQERIHKSSLYSFKPITVEVKL